MGCRLSNIVNVIGVAVILFFLVGSSMAAGNCKGKSEWPELVGTQGRIAAAIIERENHHVKAVIVKVGTGVTKDFRCDRVRVWVNTHGRVASTPIIR